MNHSPAAKIKKPERCSGGIGDRLPDNGYPSPEGIQKLTRGSAPAPNHGKLLGLRQLPYSNPVEWYGPFGWTTSVNVCRWFDDEFRKYEQRKALRVRAHRVFQAYNRYMERMERGI